MKTWKELSDETTAENMAEHLALLNREDQFKFMKRTVTRDRMLMKTQACKDWVKNVGYPELEKYNYIITDATINEGLPPKPEKYLYHVNMKDYLGDVWQMATSSEEAMVLAQAISRRHIAGPRSLNFPDAIAVAARLATKVETEEYDAKSFEDHLYKGNLK